MSNIIIQNIKESTIYFTCSSDELLNLTIKLYSGSGYSHFKYSTTMDLISGLEYWIIHPCLSYVEKIKMVVLNSDDKVIEEHILNLVKQKCHIINIVGAEDYDRIKDYLNGSYWEIFIDDTAGMKSVDVEVLKSCKNVVDLGSNAGFFGRYLSQYVRMDNYICVEPNDNLNNINRILNKNIAKNHVIDNSVFYDKHGTEIDFYSITNPQEWACSTTCLKFKDEWEKDGNFVFDNKDLKISTSLKKIIEDNDLEVVDFLKVDIEGSEIYLLSPDNMKILKNKVKYISVEYHSDEIRDKFAEAFSKDGFEIYLSKGNHFQIKNTNLVEYSKRILLKITCVALGDTLCSTPTVRKVSQCYGGKVSIQTYQPDLFKNNPYVDKIYTFDDNINDAMFDEIFETYNQWIRTNKNLSDIEFDRKIELKLSIFEARQIHALGVGISLYPEEMHCDYIPGEQTEKTRMINKDFLVFHVTKSWPNRTWSDLNWQCLTNLIKSHTDFKIVLVGKSHKERVHLKDMDKKVISLDDVDLNYCIDNDDLLYQQNKKMKYDTISELWHVINNSFALVSFDSGPIHIAGTTEAPIVWMRASVRPEKTAPYRHGRQDYKFYNVGGECEKYCSSELMYSVKEWGTINAMPYYPACQEKYDKFYCHPTPEQVFFKICEIKENSKE